MVDDQSAAGQVTVVTGAAGGMGQAVCERLASEGWLLVMVDHNAPRLAALHARLGPAHIPVACELADAGVADRVATALDDRMPRGLVNLAGVSRGAPASELGDDDWEASFQVNVTAPMRLARLCLPLMRAGGGSIINVGSSVGMVGARKASYAASKAALHGLTMSLAREGGPHGIRVNTLLPGPTVTHMTRDWTPAKQEAIASGTFLKRLCTPAEIAQVVTFLLSPQASYLTGSIIDMTAGSLYGH